MRRNSARTTDHQEANDRRERRRCADQHQFQHGNGRNLVLHGKGEAACQQPDRRERQHAGQEIIRRGAAVEASARKRCCGRAAPRCDRSQARHGPSRTASNPRNVAAFKPGRHAANPTGSRALPTGAVLCRYRMILRRSGSHRYLQLRTASRCIWSFGPLRSLRAGAHRLSKRSISCRRTSRLHGGCHSEESNTDSVVWIHWRSGIPRYKLALLNSELALNKSSFSRHIAVAQPAPSP
jgi:hypothetical protein